MAGRWADSHTMGPRSVNLALEGSWNTGDLVTMTLAHWWFEGWSGHKWSDPRSYYEVVVEGDYMRWLNGTSHREIIRWRRDH